MLSGVGIVGDACPGEAGAYNMSLSYRLSAFMALSRPASHGGVLGLILSMLRRALSLSTGTQQIGKALFKHFGGQGLDSSAADLRAIFGLPDI